MNSNYIVKFKKYPKSFYREYIVKIVKNLSDSNEKYDSVEFAKFVQIMMLILDRRVKDGDSITYKEFEKDVMGEIMNLENTIECYLKMIEVQNKEYMRQYREYCSQNVG